MSSAKVYSALNSYIQNNAIDLWTAANGSQDLTGMLPVLGLFNIIASYPLTQVVLTQSPSGASVRLTGKGSFNGANPYAANATLQYMQDGDVFSLELAVSSNWVFSDFFSSLPDTLMQVPATRLGITWYPSVLNGMTVRTAVFTGRSGEDKLTLTGFLLQPNNQYLLDKTPMIGPWPLRLSGTVEMPTANRSYPLIRLDVRGNDTIINASKEIGVDGPDAMALANPGLTLLVQPLRPPQPNKVAFSTVELFADFALGEIKGRISTLILSTDKVWNFTVRFNKDTASLVQGLAQLTRIFGVELPIPMNFPVLSDFYVGEIDIDLQNTSTSMTMPSFSLLNLAVTIRSDKTWNPPVPFVTLDKVGTRWVWGWSKVNGNSGLEKSYTLTGSVFGTINFGGSGTQTILYPPPLPPGDVPDESNTQLTVTNKPVSLNVKMSLPDFIISGSLAEDSYIPIGQALTYYFGNIGPSTGPQTMNVTKLNFSADPIGQNYFAQAQILFGDPLHPDAQQGWIIDLFIITIILNQLEFNIAVNDGKVSGGISGTFFLDQGDPSDYKLPRIMLSAEYPPQDPEIPQGWTLTGLLYPGTSISITKLVYKFIYGGSQTQPPSWVTDLDLAIDRLSVVFTTGSTSKTGVKTGASYTFCGTISMRWEPKIFDTELKISASASVDLAKPASSNTASGTITGTFSVNKIMLTVSLTFGVPEATYLFKVQFEQLWLQATTSWRGEQNNRHQVVSLQLGGTTLGDVLEYLVNLAAPTIGFQLESPWDVLKKIDLSRFVLTIDPKENIVEFVFNANVDLVVAQLDSIGVRYSKKSGEGKVDLILTGSFLGQQYTPEKPLSWDVVNDPPPAVPGQGTSLVNLRYLGLGQRVTFSGPTPNTVAESIAKLKQDMAPPPAEGNPLPNTMSYAADSQWLIGLDIQLMETVDLALIFNDPKLYGLSIALSGERAGSLAGLRFEILYKKITNEIGMFRIEFQVPDMFRTIQLGAVSITLGIIVVEIYTNGNFKVDLGFPYNRNFDRSFSLQAAIFIGRGGFYLGVLNGDTSTQVPRISNGNFSPVIELGIGIAAGVGREIRAGILEGGAYVELQVIFQGVLAWFNPNSSGAAPATYFKCQGIAALHGKIYGSVDFVVIKVSVTLEAYAQVSIIYESYQPMLIELEVDVRAEASIKILFIRIHFSFGIHLELEFTVGSAQPTPWILSNNSSSGSTSTLSQSAGRHLLGSGRNVTLRANKHRRLLTLRDAHYTAMLAMQPKQGRVTVTPGDYILNWQPAIKVFPDSPRKAHLTLLPLFTIGGVPVNWDGTVPVNNNPDYRSAFVLFADTGIAVSAATAADCTLRNSAHSGMTATDSDTSLLAADILTQGLLLFAIDSLPRPGGQGNTITAWQIALLLEQLDMPETMSQGITIPNLISFFNTNINLWISGDVSPRPNEKSAMVLPLPPFLSWTSAQGGNVDFSNKNEIGPWYEWGISQLLNNYFPVGGENSSKPLIDNPLNYESFTSFMFRDFCLILIQNGVKEMQKHLNNTTVTVATVSGTVQNLEQVAATLPTASVPYTISSGDTVENVAESMGATVEELVFLNPDLATDLQTLPVGSTITIQLGIAPEVLAMDNADTAFAVNQCELGTLVHQASQTDTLQTIATLFQVADVVTLLSYQNKAYPVLSSGSNILNTGSSLDLPQQIFSNAPADFVQLRTAAAFFVRYIDLLLIKDTPVPAMANWYVQAITEVNQGLLQKLFPDQTIPSVVELPPGQTLSVPSAFQNAYTDVANRNTYTTITGDTLNRIGYALAFQQDFGTSTPAGIPQWPTFRAGVTAAGAQSWSVPAWTGISIEAGSTIESLVRRLVVDASWISLSQPIPTAGTWTYNWSNVAVWLAGANVLSPLACITVPDAKTAVITPLNFTILSKTYGLTVTDAATKLKAVHGLYADGTVLLVKLLPAQDIDVLVKAVLQGDSFVSIVNQSSRMLMSGLQLPALQTDALGHTIPDPANSLPLYDLTGQQFNITLDSTQPTATALALSLSAEENWIQLFSSITVQTGQTLAGLEATYPNLLTYNPGLSDTTFKVGMVLLTAIVNTLDYNYTNADILGDMPETGLAILPVPPVPPSPAVMPIRGTVLRTYGLDHRIELQTPVSLPIPQVAGQQNVTGNPGLWMFPADLLEKATNRVTTLYEILAAQKGAAAGAKAIQINNSTFGTLIPFKIKKLDKSESQFNLIGVDTDKRNMLISLSNWLRGQSSTDTTRAYLLLSPAPDATNTSGLTILTAAATSISLVKTNLSTISVPPALLLRSEETEEDTNVPVYYATLSGLADFLMLLWEGSVVGGTGYYFSPGQKIPGSAFDQQGNITLQILVIVGVQQALAPNGRSLLFFNNCVLIGTGTNSSELSVFVESAGSADPSETIVQALVPPGNVGFDLLVANPDSQKSIYTDKEIQLKNLYSLLSFEVAQKTGSPFAAPPSGMPVLPDPSDGVQLQPWEKARALRKAMAAQLEGTATATDPLPKPYWRYSQVLPVSRFILPNTPLAAADVKGLPAVSADPYQGFGTQTTMPSADFVFGLGDVLGNRTGVNGNGQGTTSIPVGYTDNLIGIGDWPSIARSFTVQPSGSNAQLTVVIASRPSELLPTPSQSGDVNKDKITQQQQQFGQAYYQLIQTGLTGWIVSSLNYIADPDYGNKGIEISDISPLWKFAAGAYATTAGLGLLKAAMPTGGTTLGDIITQYGIRYAELAQANAGYLIQDLFGNTLPTVPAYYPFVQHLSITSLYALPPEGWPLPATAVTLLTLPENTSLPLKTGATLAIAVKTIPTGSVQPTDSLQTQANNNHTTVAYLAVQNEDLPVLQIGFEFVVDVDEQTEVVVKVDAATNSFKLVADAFATKGVNITVQALAAVHKDATGLLAINQTLNNSSYVVQEGDTLALNSSGMSIQDLANINGSTPDLFDPGALIYFGNFAGVTAGNALVTLQQFADRYACPMELLLSTNPGFVLPVPNKFVVPGTLSWPDDTSSVSIPYTIRPADILNTIAQRFSFDTTTVPAGMQLATRNENMPGTIVASTDLTIPVGGKPYIVNTGNSNPSFASVLLLLKQQAPLATLQDIVTAIGDSSGKLNPGGLFLCPPAKFQQDSTPDSINGLYGVSARAFALANTAMPGIIAPGKTLQAPKGTVTVDTQNNDTFNSLITRFAEKGVQLNANEIADANPTVALIRSGALAFIPPAEISFSVNIGEGGPYLSPIVPLQVSVRLLRPSALIDPGFKTPTGTGPVEMAESDFPAPVHHSTDDSDLNFNVFVTAMKTALPQLRLGTGQVNGVVQDLWQVNFDSNGIKEVQLTGGTMINNQPRPRYFALKPLYRYLVTRTISVSPLTEDGNLGLAQEVSLQSIDVELWARRFVEDMDRFLSGPYAMAIYNDTTIRDQLTLVMDAKTRLIPLVAAGLNTVLDITDAGKIPATASAVEAFKQQLGVSLSKTYEATVLIQYDSVVDSAWQSGSGLRPAALYGDGDIISTLIGEHIPGLTMIAAKTNLALANDYVNFLMMMDNPDFRKDISGSFSYAISHLEFNISSEDLPDHYKASDWLSFVPLLAGAEKPAALSGTDPGTLDVPIPLRIFPDMPKIVTQQALQSYPDGTETVNQLGVWDYDYVYSHQHAGQDYVVIRVEFNLKPPIGERMAAVISRDLFTELAQYITVANPLWTLINGLTDPETKLPIGHIENAVGTFATLATNISNYWGIRLSQDDVKTDVRDLMIAGMSYEFNARVSYRDTSGDLDTLSLKRLGTQPGPNNTWPDTFVQLPSGLFQKLELQSGALDTAVYKVPDTVNLPPVAWPVFKLTWGDLNLAQVQNARSQMHVQRNENLLDQISTNPDFIFSTDTVVAPSIVTPLNNFGKRVDITALGSTLTDALNACFNALFGPAMNGQKITVELSYGFELVAPSGPSDQGLVTYLPIGLYPNQTLSATTASDLNDVIVAWKGDNNPVEKGGEWVFSFKQYSQLTDYPHTLLNIAHLVYRITPKK